MKILSTAAMAAAALFLATEAAATTVLTFDDLAEPGTGFRELSPNSATFEYGGFVFKSAVNVQSFRSHRADDPRNADPGGTTLFHTWDRTWMEVTKADGLAFDLISMDIADVYNEGRRAGNEFLFKFADGSTESWAFTTDNLAGLETLILNRKGLRSFSMAAAPTGWWQMDNITFDTPVSAVPEPSAWAMMILGFGGLGVVLRRNRRTLQLA